MCCRANKRMPSLPRLFESFRRNTLQSQDIRDRTRTQSRGAAACVSKLLHLSPLLTVTVTFIFLLGLKPVKTPGYHMSLLCSYECATS